MHSRQAILSTLLPLAFLASTVSGFIRPMGFSAAGECHRHITLINLHQDPHSRPWLPSDRIRCQDCGGKLLIKEYSTSYLLLEELALSFGIVRRNPGSPRYT
jgi:DNA-directed RNA polymerase subunit RPC12/RpoP